MLLLDHFGFCASRSRPCGPRGDPPQVHDAQMAYSADFSNTLKKSALSRMMSRTGISTSIPDSAQPSGPLQKRRGSKASGLGNAPAGLCQEACPSQRSGHWHEPKASLGLQRNRKLARCQIWTPACTRLWSRAPCDGCCRHRAVGPANKTMSSSSWL